MFYPPQKPWTEFASEDEKLEASRRWGLVAPKAKSMKPVVYAGPGVDRPMRCNVVGCQEPFFAVVEVEGNLSCIHGDFLAETQPDIPGKLLDGLTVPAFLQDYVVIDLETTGFDRHIDAIIEVAAIRYSYGQEVSRFQQLVNPHRTLSPEIIGLTGITQDMVDDAPCFDDIGDALLEFLGDSPIVGHNAISFDIPFLEYHLRTELHNPKADTLPIARRTFPDLPSYKLQNLDKTLELGATTAHRAMADVETTHALLMACMVPDMYRKKIVQITVSKKPDKAEEPKKQHSPKIWKFSKYTADPKSIHPTTCVNQDSQLCGKIVVFTGELSMPRGEAMQLAVNAGAVLKNFVSGKTNYLVVGKQDITIVGADGMSGKEEKAYTLNDSGKGHIEIISEEEFLKLVGGCGNG